MGMILEYIEREEALLSILLVALLFAAFFFYLYRRERKWRLQAENVVWEKMGFQECFCDTNEECFVSLRAKDLKVQYVSENFWRMLGIKDETFRNDIESIVQLITPQEKRRILGLLKAWPQADEPVIYIDTTYHKLGEDVLRHGKFQVWCTDAGLTYLCSLRDDTREAARYAQLEEKLARAYDESKQKTDFLSNMSHEIRTPMNGISGMLKLMRMHLGDTKAIEEYLGRMEDLTQFLLTLINDILDMSRIESGKMELEKAPFDLFTLAEKLDIMFRGTAEAKGIIWDLKMQDFDTRYVLGDEMRLSQVIINFISNAYKFTPAGGKVTVLFRQMDKINGSVHLMIRVKDTGKGIREDFISKIFRPFEQEDASTAHNYGGSGLGMAIADRIVKLMNGQILVESEEGKGSEFSVYLTLPIAEDKNQQIPTGEFAERVSISSVPGQSKAAKGDAFRQTKAAADQAGQIIQTGEYTEKNAETFMQARQQLEYGTEHAVQAEESTFSLKGLRILLAEDNDINAEIAMEILGMEGILLERARDGVEAVSMFKESSPGTYDAILMDIQMPNMDGWTAAEVIRKLDRKDADLPILAMSANAFVEDRRKSAEVGMNGHINKPVDYEEVRRLLGECLTSKP